MEWCGCVEIVIDLIVLGRPYQPSFDSSVGRAVDCSGEVIHRSLVQIRLEGSFFFFFLCLFFFFLQYFNDHSNVTHSSEDLVATRGEIWKLLRGTEFKAVVFHQVLHFLEPLS